MDAAAALLAEGPAGSAVTLRGIARRAGIAAPSVYPYFADRDAVLDAVVAETFTALAHALRQAVVPQESAATTVRAVCRAYLGFAVRHPGLYRTLFERTAVNSSAGAPTYEEGLAAFEVLRSVVVDAVADGSSTSTDPSGDTACLWMALHGLATLPPAMPGFPWPGIDHLLERLVVPLAHLRR